MMAIRIEYDDDAEAIITKINECLKEHKLRLVFDQQDHDGYNLVNLIKTHTKPTKADIFACGYEDYYDRYSADLDDEEMVQVEEFIRTGYLTWVNEGHDEPRLGPGRKAR